MLRCFCIFDREVTVGGDGRLAIVLLHYLGYYCVNLALFMWLFFKDELGYSSEIFRGGRQLE